MAIMASILETPTSISKKRRTFRQISNGHSGQLVRLRRDVSRRQRAHSGLRPIFRRLAECKPGRRPASRTKRPNWTLRLVLSATQSRLRSDCRFVQLVAKRRIGRFENPIDERRNLIPLKGLPGCSDFISNVSGNSAGERGD